MIAAACSRTRSALVPDARQRRRRVAPAHRAIAARRHAGALRCRSARWPRFAVAGLHRNLTLLAIVFVAVHVVTTIADGYAPIGVVATRSSRSRRAIGRSGSGSAPSRSTCCSPSSSRACCARASGPLLACACTGSRTLSWPVALVHAFGTGSDARFGWLASLGFASLAIVALAVLARAGLGAGPSQTRLGAAVAAVAAPCPSVSLWYRAGPLAARLGGSGPERPRPSCSTGTRPASSGDVSLVRRATDRRRSPRPVGPSASGKAHDGSSRVVVSLRLRGGPRGAARIDLRGVPVGRGVSLTASGALVRPGDDAEQPTPGRWSGSTGSTSSSPCATPQVTAASSRLPSEIDARARVVTGIVTTRGDGE